VYGSAGDIRGRRLYLRALENVSPWGARNWEAGGQNCGVMTGSDQKAVHASSEQGENALKKKKKKKTRKKVRDRRSKKPSLNRKNLQKQLCSIFTFVLHVRPKRPKKQQKGSPNQKEKAKEQRPSGVQPPAKRSHIVQEIRGSPT